MRLGVLDIGSNTGHLLVVDAHDGAAPLPAYSHKEPLRLAEHLDETARSRARASTRWPTSSPPRWRSPRTRAARRCSAFATSAVRDADNSDEVLGEVRDRTGVDIEVLPGEDEARLTFLAVRRWFGWSSGRLAVFDIGGGSLRDRGRRRRGARRRVVAAARRGRLARDHLADGPVRGRRSGSCASQIRAEIARDAGNLLRHGTPDHAVATSKTFRSLARICGAAPSADGPLVPRVLPADELHEWIPKLAAMSDDELARPARGLRRAAPTRSCRARWSPTR